MSKKNDVKAEELELDDYRDDERDQVVLKTHEEINRDLTGELQKIELGYVELKLITREEMVADDQGLIHAGFIFSAADFAAMAAVNEKNVILVGSECQFLSPVRLGDEVNFIAKVRHKDGRKRNVHVSAFVFDIKVFDGEFVTVITERHVLKLKLLDEQKEAS